LNKRNAEAAGIELQRLSIYMRSLLSSFPDVSSIFFRLPKLVKICAEFVDNGEPT